MCMAWSQPLNADARAGEIRVEVLDQKGKPIRGFSAEQCHGLQEIDSLRVPVDWNAQRRLADLKGEVVRLRFRLQNAKLFAFQVQP